MIETTQERFEEHVVRASHTVPVLVDFWAPWCAPCRVLGPVLEGLEEKWQGRFSLVKVNTETTPALAARYRISSIPAVKLFVDGQIRAEFAGALPEPMLESFLREHLPSAADRLVEEALAEQATGQPGRFEDLLRKALDEDPDHARARLLLAGALLPTDRRQATELISPIGEGHALYDGAAAVARLADLLELASAPDPSQVHTGSRGWPQFCAGLEALRDARYGEAAEAWIEVIKTDRRLLQDGARKACVALFTWLGDDHPVTREHRKAFSSALF